MPAKRLRPYLRPSTNSSSGLLEEEHYCNVMTLLCDNRRIQIASVLRPDTHCTNTSAIFAPSLTGKLVRVDPNALKLGHISELLGDCSWA